MSVVFIGIFLVGIGVSFYFSFGLPYVDDNSERSNRYKQCQKFMLTIVNVNCQ